MPSEIKTENGTKFDTARASSNRRDIFLKSSGSSFVTRRSNVCIDVTGSADPCNKTTKFFGREARNKHEKKKEYDFQEVSRVRDRCRTKSSFRMFSLASCFVIPFTTRCRAVA